MPRARSFRIGTSSFRTWATTCDKAATKRRRSNIARRSSNTSPKSAAPWRNKKRSRHDPEHKVRLDVPFRSNTVRRQFRPAASHGGRDDGPNHSGSKAAGIAATSRSRHARQSAFAQAVAACRCGRQSGATLACIAAGCKRLVSHAGLGAARRNEPVHPRIHGARPWAGRRRLWKTHRSGDRVCSSMPEGKRHHRPGSAGRTAHFARCRSATWATAPSTTTRFLR